MVDLLRIGVEPFTQCAGVRTIYGASNPSDETIAAMDTAAEAFVAMDEFAEVASRRMAGPTGAEWGVITSGTASAPLLATVALPELIQS
ncbi:hypothetical protein [Bradyrhizobium sp. UFLA05-112]